MLRSGDFKRPSTLADSVEECILQYMKKEKLSPGDLLPKEEEIAENLNVSRHIVREGISGLKTLGIIEARKRKGMSVCSKFNAFESVRKLARAELFSREEHRQFMQMRVIMEMGMIHYIWKRKKPEDILELQQLVEKDNENPSIQDEIQFHTRLFIIGGNDIANQFQNILFSAFHYPVQPTAKNWDKDIPTHSRICEVLAHGTKSSFTRIMEQHFKPYL